VKADEDQPPAVPINERSSRRMPANEASLAGGGCLASGAAETSEFIGGSRFAGIFWFPRPENALPEVAPGVSGP